MQCEFVLTNDNADMLVEVTQPYPAAWFPLVDDEFEMPEGFNPAEMNQVGCEGQYVGMVAQNGVPFTHRYPDVIGRSSRSFM